MTVKDIREIPAGAAAWLETPGFSIAHLKNTGEVLFPISLDMWEWAHRSKRDEVLWHVRQEVFAPEEVMARFFEHEGDQEYADKVRELARRVRGSSDRHSDLS